MYNYVPSLADAMSSLNNDAMPSFIGSTANACTSGSRISDFEVLELILLPNGSGIDRRCLRVFL